MNTLSNLLKKSSGNEHIKKIKHTISNLALPYII